MPDAQLHPRPRVQQGKHTSSKPQVSRSQPAFPARWCYGLSRALPGVRALIATVVERGVSDRRADIANSRNLTPASGCRDHTPLPSAFASLVRRHQRVHRIPLPTSVTIAIRPSSGGGTGASSMISDFRKSEYFCRRDWTGQIALIARENFSSMRKSVVPRQQSARLRLSAPGRPAPTSAETSAVCGYSPHPRASPDCRSPC